MKKTYLQPKLVVVNVKIKSAILEGSYVMSSNKAMGENGGWAREDNSWDIWGSDDED